ncbi:DUF512 domain-containing protein [bacterium]|nr:DUF512 domain-containing protein [bacterium]
MSPARVVKSPGISRVDKDSPAAAAGLLSGDRVVRINGHAVHDLIDLQFYGADESLSIEVQREGKRLVFEIPDADYQPLGIHLEPDRTGCCGNHCIFCFVDQNPPGMRDSLYVKDEDYRLSFLHGNFVTMTRIGDHELQRIAEQRLSPLYISIHAVQPGIRKKLLGIKKDDGLLAKLRFLAENNIEMHGQIVLCPGINDGPVLTETVDTLAALFPHLRTCAVVPVGLTRHRSRLPGLMPVTPQAAESVIRQIAPVQKSFMRGLGEAFVYLADEFYLTAGRPLPDEAHYGEFWQIENGVGMTAAFLGDFERISATFPDSVARPESVLIVTGQLAAPVLERHVLPVLNRIRNFRAGLVAVENRFFGHTVTVSGLLTGGDMMHALRSEDLLSKHQTDRVLLPDNCINTDGLLPDDRTPETMQAELGIPVQVISGFQELWN